MVVVWVEVARVARVEKVLVVRVEVTWRRIPPSTKTLPRQELPRL